MSEANKKQVNNGNVRAVQYSLKLSEEIYERHLRAVAPEEAVKIYRQVRRRFKNRNWFPAYRHNLLFYPNSNIEPRDGAEAARRHRAELMRVECRKAMTA